MTEQDTGLRCFSSNLFPGNTLVMAVGVFWDENQPAETLNDALMPRRVALHCCTLHIFKSAVFHTHKKNTLHPQTPTESFLT